MNSYRYISCNSCHKWYHLRCTNIGIVLPGLLENEIKSSAVDFYCGLKGCESKESYCRYNKKNSYLKFPITFAPTSYSSSEVLNSQSELINVESVANNSEIYYDDSENSHTEIVLSEDTIEDLIDEESTDAVSNGEKRTNQTFTSELNRQMGINKVTLNDLTGCSFPESGYFVKDLLSLYTGSMESHVWDDLAKNIRTMGSKKYFRKGTWQHVIADIIARFNPYCTIVFKRHLVYMSDIRTSRTDLLFVTNGKCQHEKYAK